MENVSIQPYSESYQQHVIDLILDIQQNEFSIQITLEQQPDLTTIFDFYQKGNGNFWIALYANTVVGTIALIDIGDAQLALRKMFVHHKFRGKEYNTAQLLLDAAIHWAKQRECKQIFLGTLDIFKAAQKFYRKHGFKEIPKGELPPKFPAMTLDNTFFKKDIDTDNHIIIVNYESQHQPLFEKFNRAWIEKYFWMETVDNQVLQQPKEHILNKGGIILMAKMHNEWAGTVALKYVEPGIYEFTKMAVDEKFQGKKVGQALSHAAIEKAKRLGAKRIILYSNTKLEAAIALYRKIGFKEIPVDGPYKRSNIKMELIL